MTLADYTLLSANYQRQHLQVRVKQLITVRWAYIFLIAGSAVIASLLGGASSEQPILFAWLGAVALSSNFLLWLLVRRRTTSPGYYQTLIILATVIDLILASYAIYSQGGIASRATILYAVPILSAGIMFSRTLVYFAAGLSAAGYIISITSHAWFNDNTLVTQDLIVPAIFYPVMFFIVAALSTILSGLKATAEKDRAYSELLAMLTHQLRHPNSTIAAILDTFTRHDINLDNTQRRYLKLIAAENRRSRHLIDNLLEGAKVNIAQPPFSKVNLNQLVESSAQSCGLASNRMADITLNLPDQPIIIAAHPEHLRMALDNIIDNALRYSKRGQPVNISLAETAQAIIITVTDHGKGMSKKQQQLLFHSFGNNEPVGGSLEGAGLGLSVSKRIIEASNGSLRLQSQPERGTKVTITYKKGSIDEEASQ